MPPRLGGDRALCSEELVEWATDQFELLARLLGNLDYLVNVDLRRGMSQSPPDIHRLARTAHQIGTQYWSLSDWRVRWARLEVEGEHQALARLAESTATELLDELVRWGQDFDRRARTFSDQRDGLAALTPHISLRASHAPGLIRELARLAARLASQEGERARSSWTLA
ncbi:MAG: hypothetical protein U0271_30855 [Polyangiaceae bacterium]